MIAPAKLAERRGGELGRRVGAEPALEQPLWLQRAGRVVDAAIVDVRVPAAADQRFHRGGGLLS